MYKLNKYLIAARYTFLIVPIFGYIYFISKPNFYVYIALILTLLFNTQVRFFYRNKYLIMASILIDLPIIYYLHVQDSSFIFLIYHVTLLDSFLLSKTNPYYLMIIISLFYIGSTLNSFPVEYFLILLVSYTVYLLFLIHTKGEIALLSKTEYLYDQIRKTNYELESARIRILDYSKQVEKVAQLEERNRIARELHDTIGHSLTGVLMQVDAAIQLIEKEDKKGLEILHAAYSNINNSIETVRQTVHQLRPIIYQNFVNTLHTLIEQFSNSTKVNVYFKITGDIYELTTAIEIAIYRNIQEALTNSVRHGNAKNIDITIAFFNENIIVLISDDGLGAKEIKYGFGLLGMKERVDIVGGSIHFEAKDGFHIKLIIPTKEVKNDKGSYS